MRRIGLPLVLILLVGTGCPPPGKGRAAEQGYEAGQPVIEALEAHKKSEGTYPESLEVLVPDRISEIPVDPDGEPFGYRLTEEGYELDFGYTGPGINHCVYTPRGREWWCEGAY